MKKKILILLAASMLSLHSCNYLDIVPDDTAKLVDGFRNEQTTEGFLYSCYSYLPRYNDARTNFSWLMSNETVGSYHWGTQWFSFLRIQQLEFSADDPVLNTWDNAYKGIRQCHLFLENVDKATAINISKEELEVKKKVWKAEAKFLLAFFHYVILQNYGPAVIVDSRISTDATGTDFAKPRSSYDETVEYIANKLDEAAVDLPLTIAANSDYGRVTKVIAQAVKSRLYLYAASPQFNGNTDYASFTNKDGKQLISQSYNKEKWKKAMDETKKAIQLAESVGNKLYEYTKTSISDPFKKAVMNTRWQMVDPWNSELIWGYTGFKENNDAQYSFQSLAVARGWRTGVPYGAISASLESVELFYSKNGLPGEKDPNYDWQNRFTIASGDETIKLHRDREPRFYAYIGFDRGEYEINNETRILKLRAGETNGLPLQNGVPFEGTDQAYSGYTIKKGIHPSTNVSTNSFTVAAYPFPLIRLGELYLNYAEAVANYTGTLDADGTRYIDAIRSRAGIPSLATSYGPLTGTALVEAVQRERLIEMMFEGHSLYDRKRWKTALATYTPNKKGMRGLTTTGITAADFYKPRNLPGRPFVFEARQYLFPIKNEFVKVNENLVQNPGW